MNIVRARRQFSRSSLVALCCAAPIACREANVDAQPEPGTDYVALMPENVVEVTFTLSDTKLYAYRWQPGSLMHVLVGRAKPDVVEHCQGGDGFMRWLSAATTVSVTKELTESMDSAGGDWATLRFRDSSDLEPVFLKIRVPSGAQTVVIEVKGRRYATSMNGVLLRSALSGCSALGTPE